MIRFSRMFLLPVLLVVLAFSSCTDKEVGKMIPSDAAMVTRFDLKKVLTSVDKDEVDVEALKEKFKKQLGLEKAKEDEKALIEEVLDDPSVLGVDVTEPIYYFLSKDYEKHDGVFIGSVSDADKIEEFVASVKKVDPESDFNVAVYNDLKYVNFGEDALMLYNDDWFAFAEHDWRNDGFQQDAEHLAQLFNLSESMSMYDNKAFNQFCKEDGVFQFLVYGAGLDEMGDRSAKKQLSALLPSDVHVDDFAFLFNFALEKGATTVNGELISLTSEAEDYIDDLPSEKIDGNLKDYITNDALFYTLGNLDGDEFFERIKSIKNVKVLMDSDPMIAEAVKNIYSAFDGDIAVVLENYESESYLPNFAFLAETQNDKWLDIVKQFAALNVVQKTGEKSYLFESHSRSFQGQVAIGSQDDMAFVVGHPEKAALQKADECVKEVGKGLYGYGHLNIGKLLSVPAIDNVVRGAENPMFATRDFLNLFDYVEIKMEEKTKSSIALIMKDRDMTLTTAILRSFK